MSAIAGCFWFNRKPASIHDLRESTDAGRHRARGPFRAWSSGPVALAYGDHSDHQPPQPWHEPSSRLTAVVDGPIDNLADVAHELGMRAASAPCAVALAAYRRWGLAAGSQLLGDFVIVIYDGTEERLTCLRDPMGQRPLFYGVSPRAVVFGSEPQQVVRHPAIGSEINEPMIAEHLADMPTTMAETIWRDVYRVPPGHAIEVCADGARVRRYWDFDPGARVSHSSLEECDEHFREVFTRALRCRVPDDAPIGVFLSGGIDSSAIAGLAHAIGAPVHALTVAFRGSACDETPFSDAVIGKFGLAATRIDAAPPSPRAIALETHRSLDVPRYPNSLAADPLRDRAREMGIRMVLTGCGGDDFFAGASEPLRDVVRARGVVVGARALVGPLLSERARRRLRPLFGARANCPWIRPEFARRINLDERLRPLPAPPFPSREQQDLYRGATGLARVLGDEMEDRAAHATGVEQRHPFYDRRVAEFGFSLPSSERWNRGTHKVLLRRALARHLPAVVAARHDKAEFSPTFVEALEAIGGRPSFDRLRSEEAGWVDGVVVRRMYDDMIQLYRRGGDAYIAHTGPLWAVAALETWFERAEGIPR